MTTELFGVTPAVANTASPARRHKMVARGLLVAVMAGGLALGMALPAAAVDDTTAVTIQITGGDLAITAPTDSVALGAATKNDRDGTTLAVKSLGAVTVVDEHGTAVGGWVATVASSDFTASAGGKTIPASALSYKTVAATTTFGAPTLLTETTFVSGKALTTTGQLVVTGTRSGQANNDNDASWTPDLTLTIPGGLDAAIYTATITHSVT